MQMHKPFLFAIWLALAGLCLAGAPAVQAKGKGNVVLSKSESLTDSDGKDTKQTESYCKVYKVKLTEGVSYRIDLSSKDFDTYLRLEDAGGKQLDENDDIEPGKDLNSRIEFTPPKTAEYRIIATSFDGGATGEFKLMVVEAGKGKAIGGGKSQFNAEATELKLKDGKATVKAEFTDKDSTVGGFKGIPAKTPPGNRYYKVFTATFEAGKTYKIDMSDDGGNAEFDSFLILEDADGKFVAFNDDVEQGNLNSRIVHQAKKSGTYRIICTTFVPDQTGKFSLEVVPASKDEEMESSFLDRLRTLDKATAAEQKQLVKDLTTHLQKKGGKVSFLDAQMAYVATAPIEGTPEAADVFKTFTKILAASDDAQVAKVTKMFERYGKEFPVTGKKTDGKDFDLKNLKGKVVLVDFWATWCGPCIAELPNVEAAYKKYHGKGFEIIGISLDKEGDDDKLANFLEKRKTPWGCINIEDSRKLAETYEVEAIPFPVLIGPDGRLVSLRARGPQLERLLERMLSEQK
jgi:thiol-disulfide isomerase/thioredoxin